MTLSKVSDLQAPVREAGGDNEVPRNGKGQPLIEVMCWLCYGTGRRTNKKTGNPNKCTGCGPKKSEPLTHRLKMGRRLKPFTRVTTYIDVLDDKSNLEAWLMRMVLVGIARDPRLLNEVDSLYEDLLLAEKKGDEEQVKANKNELNRRAQIAKTTAGAEDKADKGTALHGLSELVDQGLPLPPGIDFGDVIDMDAYRRETVDFKIVHMEKVVVNDELCAAGTPDRVSEWIGSEPLIAPDGYVFEPGSGELLITDLKTGSVEYGALKMAMQLAIYANSLLYDHTTGRRSSMGRVNRKWGVIMHVPAGSGEATLYWADLTLGWQAVQVATQVRLMRSKGSKALVELVSPNV